MHQVGDGKSLPAAKRRTAPQEQATLGPCGSPLAIGAHLAVNSAPGTCGSPERSRETSYWIVLPSRNQSGASSNHVRICLGGCAITAEIQVDFVPLKIHFVAWDA